MLSIFIIPLLAAMFLAVNMAAAGQLLLFLRHMEQSY